MYPDDIPKGYLVFWPLNKPIPEGWGIAHDTDNKIISASDSTIVITKLDNLTWIEQEAKKRNLI